MRAALFLFLLLLYARASPASPGLAGHWFYYMKIYQGQEMPEPPHATLRLHYEFTATGESRLYWWHEGQDDRCERRGRYFVSEGKIVDQVVWVDPSNHFACANDPDMQYGRVTRTPFHIYDGDLYLRIAFGNDELFYVWRKIGARDNEAHPRDKAAYVPQRALRGSGLF